MKQVALKFFDQLSLTSLGLLIFFSLFACVLFWVFLKRNRPIYANLSLLPLQDDGEEGSQNGR